MAEIYVKVETGSEEFGIDQNGRYPLVHLTEKPENGRANTELVNRFQEILGHKPGIVSGQASRRKKLRVDMSQDELERKLEAADNG